MNLADQIRPHLADPLDIAHYGSFRAALAARIDTMDGADLLAIDKADHVIRIFTDRLSALVMQLDADDPACALLRAELRAIRAGV